MSSADGRRVKFELTEATRFSVMAWLQDSDRKGSDFLFPSRIDSSQHLSTRQYARLIHAWIWLSRFVIIARELFSATRKAVWDELLSIPD